MPALYVKTGGSHAPVIQPYVRTGGTWSPVLNVWVKTAGVWELGFTGFTVSVTPTSEYIAGIGPTLTSGSFTASTTGGVGPFTYSWSQVSGGSINILTSTDVSTAFRATVMSFGEVRSGTFKCTATDTVSGVSTDSNTITVTFEAT